MKTTEEAVRVAVANERSAAASYIREMQLAFLSDGDAMLAALLKDIADSIGAGAHLEGVGTQTACGPVAVDANGSPVTP